MPKVNMFGPGFGAGLMLFLGTCATILPLQSLSPPKTSVVKTGPSLQSKVPRRDRWIVSPTEARDLVSAGATVLDASAKRRTAIAGAFPVTWQQFSQDSKPSRGKLLDDDAALTQQLQSLGVSAQRPVLVVGNPRKGWGEEGRIVWMLRTLGHPQAYMVDGGVSVLDGVALIEAGTGDFTVKRDRRWTVTGEELQQQLRTPSVQIIDSREPREFEGKTPYGESRGGHVPGAKNLYFKELLNPDGSLIPHADLVAKVEAYGLRKSDPVIVYCTGGIRSGWLTAVLVSLGYQAKNYPGSMWAWSASPAEQYPLTQSSK